MSFWINYTGRRDQYPFADGMTNRGRLNQTIMPKKLTANKGASETRHAILREMKKLEADERLSPLSWWNALRDYIKEMAKRASAKKGGLGKR